MARATFEERFFKYVEKTETCWFWRGALTRAGYGLIYRDGVLVYAHRASYEMHVGPIGYGLLVRHGCDTPRCVRPEHLSIGTQKDNLHDMYVRGRGVVGAQSNLAHISDATGSEIRRAYNAGEGTNRELGRRFGVSHQLVSKIVRGDVRRWVGVV